LEIVRVCRQSSTYIYRKRKKQMSFWMLILA